MEIVILLPWKYLVFTTPQYFVLCPFDNRRCSVGAYASGALVHMFSYVVMLIKLRMNQFIQVNTLVNRGVNFSSSFSSRTQLLCYQIDSFWDFDPRVSRIINIFFFKILLPDLLNFMRPCETLSTGRLLLWRMLLCLQRKWYSINR